MGVIQLLLGRHGPGDHYLGGRFYRPDRGRRRPSTLPFPLSDRTIHLFEHTLPSQRREPVPAQQIFPTFSTRYELTALAFARAVEAAGGRSYNVESRPTAELDEQYSGLYDAAQKADLAFFKRPIYTTYLALLDLDERFVRLREDLIEANIEHFASGGFDLVVRLGRTHSQVRRLGRRGFAMVTRTGAGSFFPEQVLRRRALFGLEVREEDRMRGYIDRLLRIVPIWERSVKLPPHELLLSLRGEELEAVRDRFEDAVHAARSLPGIRELLRILTDVAGYRPDEARAGSDPRFWRQRARPAGAAAPSTVGGVGVKNRCFVLGLDCLGPEVISPDSLAELPNLRKLVAEGLSGPLESTLPPITVPAWSSMMSGRDPGELGVYGFKNRRSYAYGDLLFATSGMVRLPRVWDLVGQSGGQSIVVGVPQTSPPPPIQGVLISGFESEGVDLADGAAFARPPEIADEIRSTVGDYIFDIDNFRNIPRETVREMAFRMTELRCRLMEHLLQTRPWDFAMLCEIAPDRLHHCFWSDHDPRHRRHQPDSPFRTVIRDYYRFVDEWIGRLREQMPPGCAFLVVSDHGAKAMDGGVCINEVLRQAGWLVLREEPAEPSPLRPQQVDWSRTRAWGEGGYYARIFLNVEGREPQGIIPFEQRDEARRELTELLSSIALPDGPTLTNRVVWPEHAYRAVRGLAPDLIVLFADLSWRSLGTVGHGRLWLVGNDTGLDEANHAQDGLFVLHDARVAPGQRRASILDVAPTVLDLLELEAPGDLTGASLLDGRSRKETTWKS